MFKQITVQRRRKGKAAAKPYTCGVCERSFRTAQGLKAHKTRLHPGKSLTEAPTRIPTDSRMDLEREMVGELGTGVEKEATTVIAKLRKMEEGIQDQIAGLEQEAQEIRKTVESLERYLKGE